MHAHPPLSGRPALTLHLWTAITVWCELCLPHWLPAAALVGGLITALWLNIGALLPAWLMAIAMVLWTGLFFSAAVRAWGKQPAVTREKIWRRLEKTNRLAHRPFDVTHSEPVNNPLTEAHRTLWERHDAAARRSVSRLAWPFPKFAIAAHDPYALRYAFLILLPLSFIMANGAWQARIETAFAPFMQKPVPQAAVRYEIWAAPPAYTKQAPVILVAADKPVTGTLTVPIGSKLTVHVSNVNASAELRINNAWQPMVRKEKGAYALEETVTEGGELALRQGWMRIAAWPLRLVNDTPPTVTLAAPTAATGTGIVPFSVSVRDDYGIAESWLILKPQDATLPLPDEELKLPVTLYLNASNEAVGTLPIDFSRHPLAGQVVDVRLQVSDAMGQAALSEAVTVTLPERHFEHPIAKAIVEQRNILLKDPAARQAVAGVLMTLWNNPGTFGRDAVTAMALRAAIMRLVLDRTGANVTSAAWLMWQTALRIEDGTSGSALQIAQAALTDLQAAFHAGLKGEELQQRIAQAQIALMNYMQALAQKMQHSAMQQDLEKLLENGAMGMQADQLMRMLEQLQELAAAGQYEQVQSFLEKLQEMMQQMLGGTPQLSEAQKLMMDKIKQIQAIADDQAKLVTVLEAVPEAMRATAAYLAEHSKAQSGIHGRLVAIIDEFKKAAEAMRAKAEADAKAKREANPNLVIPEMPLPETPVSLTIANDAMGIATKRLGTAEYTDGLAAATTARDALQQAMQSFVSAMQMLLLPGQEGQGMAGRDPLGRMAPGTNQSNETKLPDKLQIEKVRTILNELRRRASDPTRPEAEQDYLKRLLESF